MKKIVEGLAFEVCLKTSGMKVIAGNSDELAVENVQF